MFYDPKWEKPVIEPWRKALFDAADLIEKDGWSRVYYESGEKHCAVGAISKAATGWAYSVEDRVVIEAQQHMLQEINRWRFFRRKYYEVTRWNDSMNTKRNVIRTMRRAARRLPK